MMSSSLMQFTAVLMLGVQCVIGVARGQEICFASTVQSEHECCDHEHDAPVSVNSQHEACDTCTHITVPDVSPQLRVRAVRWLEVASPLVCLASPVAWTPHAPPCRLRMVVPPDPHRLPDRCALRITRLLI